MNLKKFKERIEIERSLHPNLLQKRKKKPKANISQHLASFSLFFKEELEKSSEWKVGINWRIFDQNKKISWSLLPILPKIWRFSATFYFERPPFSPITGSIFSISTPQYLQAGFGLTPYAFLMLRLSQKAVTSQTDHSLFEMSLFHRFPRTSLRSDSAFAFCTASAPTTRNDCLREITPSIRWDFFGPRPSGATAWG